MNGAKHRDSQPPADAGELEDGQRSATTGIDVSLPEEPTRASSSLLPSEELVGTLLAERYAVQELLGRGGMGAVYLAEHVHMKKLVALKILHPNMSVNPEVVARFEREAVAAGRLQHPGVVAATDFGRLQDGSFYLALEFVDGKSLAEVLAETGPLDPERALGIAYQITSALAVAHQAGIVHRDMKPDNVMLVRTDDDDDFVKVLDFGIAKVHSEGETEAEGLTPAGLVFGTPEYMSPEQAMGHEADTRSDVYGVGMLLYEMCVGQSPFHADDVTAMLTAQITELPPKLPDHVPAPLRKLVRRLLEKEADKRPRDASELSEELLELIHQLAYRPPVPRTSAGTKLELRRSSVDKRELDVVIRTGALSQLQRISMMPVSMGSKKVPLWIPAIALVLGTAAGGVWVLNQTGAGAPDESQLPVAEEQPQPLDAEGLLLVEARSGDREAIAELRKLATVKQAQLDKEGKALAAEDLVKQTERYMALGRGYSAIEHGKAAVEMYQQAVRLDPHVAGDTNLLIDVRAALGAQDAVEEGLDFALKDLGAQGADLIYDVYLDNLGEVGMTPVVARAMKLVKGDEILEHATPSLKVALALNQAKYCAEYREIIPDAAKHADDRSVLKLRALTTRRGCGTWGNKDCFVCLRHEDVPLEAAVERAATTPSPTFLTHEEREKESTPSK